MHRLCSLTLLALLGFAACSTPEPAPENPPPATAAEEEPANGNTYAMRGIVRQLPDPKDPSSQFMVHHETVPNFLESDGTMGSMDSMIMSFFVEDPAIFRDLRIGDKVAFNLQVDWNSDRIAWVTGVRKLPPDTELNLAPATPPLSDAEAAAEEAATEPHDHHAGH